MKSRVMTRCSILLGVVLALLLLAACKKDSAQFDFDLSAPMESLQLDSIIIDFSCNGGESVPKSKIPGNISDQFDESFPGAYSQDWRFYDGSYGVGFDVEHSSYQALYMVDDENKTNMLAYGVNLQNFEIPSTIESAVKNRYGRAWVINTASEIETAYHIIYELIIEKEGDKIKVFFNENGGFISSCSY